MCFDEENDIDELALATDDEATITLTIISTRHPKTKQKSAGAQLPSTGSSIISEIGYHLPLGYS